jgi:hypothetical protein
VIVDVPLSISVGSFDLRIAHCAVCLDLFDLALVSGLEQGSEFCASALVVTSLIAVRAADGSVI